MKDIIIKSMNLFLSFAINTAYDVVKNGNHKPLFLSQCKWVNPDKVLFDWEQFVSVDKPMTSQILGFCSVLCKEDNDTLMCWILENYTQKALSTE